MDKYQRDTDDIRANEDAFATAERRALADPGLRELVTASFAAAGAPWTEADKELCLDLDLAGIVSMVRHQDAGYDVTAADEEIALQLRTILNDLIGKQDTINGDSQG